MKRLHLLFITFFSLSILFASATKPYGLMTDLIEHTDYTWQNGYISNVPVWEAEAEQFLKRFNNLFLR
jgi:hypothetical protein